MHKTIKAQQLVSGHHIVGLGYVSDVHVDYNANRVKVWQRQGWPVIYGDAEYSLDHEVIVDV
jgi:hypothetical protein